MLILHLIETKEVYRCLIFTFAKNCVSWKSSLQPLVTLCTTESEYVAICGASKESVSLHKLLCEINMCDSVLIIYTVSQSTLYLSKNPVYHQRTKHTDVKFHFIRDLIANNRVKLLKVGFVLKWWLTSNASIAWICCILDSVSLFCRYKELKFADFGCTITDVWFGWVREGRSLGLLLIKWFVLARFVGCWHGVNWMWAGVFWRMQSVGSVWD